jgi:hypothetical protein
MGGFGHVYLLASDLDVNYLSEEDDLPVAAVSGLDNLLYFDVTGRSSYPALIILEHIMI